MQACRLFWITFLFLCFGADGIKWTAHGSYEYYVGNDKVTSYDEANGNCTIQQATLALVKSEDIKKILVNDLQGEPKRYGQVVLIGLRKQNNSKSYYWDDGTQLGWADWKDGQPSKNQQKCVTMVYQEDSDYQWVDAGCYATATSKKYQYYQYYVCQRARVSTAALTNVSTAPSSNVSDEPENYPKQRFVIAFIMVTVVFVCIIIIIVLVILVVREKRKNHERSSAIFTVKLQDGISNDDLDNTTESTLGRVTARAERSPASTAGHNGISDGTDKGGYGQRNIEPGCDTTTLRMKDIDEYIQPMSFQETEYETIGCENSAAASSVLYCNEGSTGL